MSEEIIIQSHKGEYKVSFNRGEMDQLNSNPIENAIYIVDKNIARLYQKRLNNILNCKRVLQIEATEENKSPDKFPKYVEQLVKLKVRRGQPLVAQGVDLDIYRRCGWKPPENDTNERDELNIRRKDISRKMSSDALETLDRLSKCYENQYWNPDV